MPACLGFYSRNEKKQHDYWTIEYQNSVTEVQAESVTLSHLLKPKKHILSLDKQPALKYDHKQASYKQIQYDLNTRSSATA